MEITLGWNKIMNTLKEYLAYCQENELHEWYNELLGALSTCDKDIIEREMKNFEKFYKNSKWIPKTINYLIS